MASEASASETTNDGPVLNLINKRLRALRKKLNRISQMEDSKSQGKKLNKEQEETLRSKSDLLAAVDELEKLKQPLLHSVAQEIELAFEKNKQKPDIVVTEDAAISDLLNLLYFSSVFDVRSMIRAQDNMLTRTHERNCCLSYDYVPDDEAAWDPLKELDLDLIAMLGGVVTSRPVNSSLSHENALKNCVEHAKLWLAKADQRIEPDSDITYAGLREKLNKIMASDYFTTTPEMKAAVEVAAAAGGNYTSFKLPTEEQSPNSLDTEGYVIVNENDHFEPHNQGEIDVENKSEIPTQTTEQGSLDAEVDQNLRDVDFKEQYAGRKSFRSGRGGRRGYSNGRGGRVGNRGGYQNGRNGQTHDQAGGYYPRNNYRGRGGRGGNSNYYAPTGHAGQAQEAS